MLLSCHFVSLFVVISHLFSEILHLLGVILHLSVSLSSCLASLFSHFAFFVVTWGLLLVAVHLFLDVLCFCVVGSVSVFSHFAVFNASLFSHFASACSRFASIFCCFTRLCGRFVSFHTQFVVVLYTVGLWLSVFV